MSEAKIEVKSSIVEVSILQNGKKSIKDKDSFVAASSVTVNGIKPSLHERQTGYRFIEAHNTQARNVEENKYSELQDSCQDVSGKWIIPCSQDTVDEKWEVVKQLTRQGLVYEAKVACTNDEYPENALFVYVYNSDDLQVVAKMHNTLLVNGVLDKGQSITYKTNRDTLDGKYTPDTVRYTSEDVVLFNNALTALSEYTSSVNQIWAAIKAFFGFGLSAAKQTVAQELEAEINTFHSNVEILQKLGQCKEHNVQAISAEKTASGSLFKKYYDPSNVGKLGEILNQVEQAVNDQTPKLK
jgi:hypothetical protein